MSEKKTYENDYSLLRAFDLEAAKRGEAICWSRDGEVLQDVTITPAGRVCGVWKSGVHQGVEETWSASIVPEKFRMAPLCWVEGKPVYKGDRLHGKWEGSRPDGYEITGLDHLGRLVSTFGLALADDHGCLTWDKPKPVKRWINVYADKYGELLHETKDAADAAAIRHRIACIEIELPPLAEVAK